MRNQEHIQKKSISFSLSSNPLNKNETKLDNNYLSFSSKPKTPIQEASLSSEHSSSSPSSSELSNLLNRQPSMIRDNPTARNHHQLDPMDALVIGKAFPETGKLLKAVVEAGPLLQTLLVAGPLPKWVNPPPQTQSQRFELSPPFSLKGSDVNNSSLNVLWFGYEIWAWFEFGYRSNDVNRKKAEIRVDDYLSK
ncbi:hypothetical protein Bca101_025367 [Brassica carinata]